MRMQGAIFDLDGTLLDSMPIWATLGSDLLRAQGRDPEPGLDDKLRAMSLRQAAAYCKAQYELAQSEAEIAAMTCAAVEDFYKNRVVAKPGVERMLSLLKMEGVWMYVATATDRPLAQAALERTGLRDYFRGVLTCGEVGGGKDSPVIYEKALRRLRCRKRDVVVFEDSLHAIRTAKAAGFRVTGVYDASEPEQSAVQAESDDYVRSFADWTQVE